MGLEALQGDLVSNCWGHGLLLLHINLLGAIGLFFFGLSEDFGRRNGCLLHVLLEDGRLDSGSLWSLHNGGGLGWA